MIQTVSPSGSGANYRLMIRNTNAMPITLEITPYRVTVDDKGVAVRTPEEADVILFPPQTVVQPSREQAIQVRYVGDPAITEGRVYAILVGQLPVDFSMDSAGEGSDTQVKIGFDFVSHMIVNPVGAKADLLIGASRREANNDLTFDVENRGTAVTILRTSEWFATGTDGRRTEIKADDIQMGTFGALLPGGRRTLTIPADKLSDVAGAATISVSLK
jgi:fimbrial chaperone protein